MPRPVQAAMTGDAEWFKQDQPNLPSYQTVPLVRPPVSLPQALILAIVLLPL